MITYNKFLVASALIFYLSQPVYAASSPTPGGSAPPDAASSNTVLNSKECQTLQNQANSQLSNSNTIVAQVAQNEGHALDGLVASLKQCLSGLANMSFNFDFNIPICALLYNVTNGLMEQLSQNINFPYGMGGVGLTGGGQGMFGGGGGDVGVNGTGSTGISNSGGYLNGSGSQTLGNSTSSVSGSKNAIFGAGASGTPPATQPSYQGYATGQVQNPVNPGGSGTGPSNLWNSAKGLFQ